MKLFSKIFLISVISVLVFSACTTTVSTPNTESTSITPVAEEIQPEPTRVEEESPVEVPEVVEPAADNPITFTDGTGREISLPAAPQKIIVAGKATPYVLDTIFLFPDVAQKLAAIELRSFDTQNFLKIVDSRLEVTTMLEKDSGPEQIAPYQPDLVILKNVSLGKLGSALEEISIPVMGMNLETPEFFYEDIKALGAAFDNSERAEEIIAYYQSIESQLSGLMADLQESEKPSVLVLQYSEDGGEVSFEVPPASYLQTTMVQKAGGNPIWLDVDTGSDGWILVGLEQIAVWNPDMIFVVNYNGDSQETAKQLMESPTWEGLKAVETQQIYGYPADFASWDLIDPRWILGQQWLATIIQPERTADINIQNQVISFYQEMYALSEDAINEFIFPLLDEIK